MKLHTIGNNQTEVTTADGTLVLYSYGTPVAAYLVVPTYPDAECQKPLVRGYIRTSQTYSATTTRHINTWLAGNPAAFVSPEFLAGLV